MACAAAGAAPVSAEAEEQRRRQLAMNQGLKEGCMALEEELVQLITPYQKAHDTWGEVTAKMRDATAALERLLRETDLQALCEFDPHRCMRDCGQQLTADQVAQRGSEQSLSELLRLSRATAYLSSKGGTAGPPPAALAADAERAAQELEFIHRRCSLREGGSIDVSVLGAVLESAVRMLRDGMGVSEQGLQQALEEQKERVRRLAFDSEHALEQQRMLFADGDVEGAERKYYDCLRSQEECCKCISQKLCVIDDWERQAVGEAMRSSEDAQRRARQQAQEVLERARQRCRALEADLAELQATAAQGESDHNDYLARYKEEITTSNDIIENNARRQNEVWMQVTSCERELARLARERYTEVQRRIQNFEQSERHRASYEQFQRWAAQRVASLEAAMDHCAATSDAVGRVITFVQSRYQAVYNHLESIGGAVDKARREVHEEYLSQFQQLYLTGGDLLHKKEQVLAQLEGNISATQLQLEICQDSLNPEAKSHAARKKELLAARAQMSEQLNLLQRQQQHYLEWFEPTRRALGIADDDSRHPRRALEEKNAARRAKLDAYQALMAAPDTDTLLLEGPGGDSAAAAAAAASYAPPAIGSPPAGRDLISPPRASAANPGRCGSLPSLEAASPESTGSSRREPWATSQPRRHNLGSSSPLYGRPAALTPQPPRQYAAGQAASPSFAPDSGYYRMLDSVLPSCNGAEPVKHPKDRAATVPNPGVRDRTGRGAQASAAQHGDPLARAGAVNALPAAHPAQLAQQQGGARRWGDGRSCDARADAILRAAGL